MPSPQIQFRAVPPLDTEVSARSGTGNVRDLSSAARRDLTRYYTLLQHELACAVAGLMPHEALLLCDALKDTYISEQLSEVRHLEHEIKYALGLDEMADRWGADGEAVLEQVREWTLAQRLAVVDAVERYWRHDAVHDDQRAALRAAGLVIGHTSPLETFLSAPPAGVYPEGKEYRPSQMRLGPVILSGQAPAPGIASPAEVLDVLPADQAAKVRKALDALGEDQQQVQERSSRYLRRTQWRTPVTMADDFLECQIIWCPFGGSGAFVRHIGTVQPADE